MSPVSRHSYRFFAALLALATANSALAAESYFKIIPASALAFCAVNNMSDASDKVQKLASVMNGPGGSRSPLDEAKKVWGANKGLDESGAAGFFIMPGKTEKDGVERVVFAAVKDVKEFLGNFEVVKAGDTISDVRPKKKEGDLNELQDPDSPRVARPNYSIAFRGGYVLVTLQGSRAALEAALDSKQDVSAEMAGLEPWLAENDGVAVGMAAGIKAAARQAEIDLKNPNSAGGSTPEIAAFAKSFQNFFSTNSIAAPKEISLAVAGVRRDKEGSIHVVGRVRLSGGIISKAIAAIPPARLKLLSGVPGGPFVVAAGGSGISGLFEGYLNTIMDIRKNMKLMGGMSDDDLDRMSKKSMEVVRQMHSMSFVMKSGKRGDPILNNIFVATDVDDAGKLLDMQEKNTDDVNKALQNAKEGNVKSIATQRIEVAGRPALQEEVNFDFSKMPGGGPDHAALDAMLGLGGKMLVYNVAADEHTMLTGVGISQERMAASLDVLKQPKKSLAEDADIAVTSAMLPADSQWVAYLSMRGYAQLRQRATAAAWKNRPDLEGLTMPDFPKSPPIGFAVLAKPEEVRAEVAVPAAVIEATGDYNKAMQQMWMNRMIQPNKPNQPAPPAP